MYKQSHLTFLLAVGWVSRCIQVFICLVASSSAWATVFQKDDQVVLTRDEPLKLYQDIKAAGTKGQLFTVLASTPADHRVYVAYKDPAGKTTGLNVDESALILLPGRGETAFRQALADLKAGRWPEAERGLTNAIALEPNESLYGDVRTHVQGILRSLAGVQQAQTDLANATILAKQKRRNADISGRTNMLDPNDHSGEGRAAADRAAAQEYEENGAAAVKTANQNLSDTLKELDTYIAQKVETHDFDVAFALVAVRLHLTPDHGAVSKLGEAAGKFDTSLALADARYDAARNDIAQSKFFTADREITEGLDTVPTHRRLKALRILTQLRLAVLDDNMPTVDMAQKKADYQGALKLVDGLLVRCPDHESLKKRRTFLEETLAEQDSALAAAASAEQARDYGKALSVYEKYGKQAEVRRVLPLLAKQEEDSGNFIRAAELYSRAGMEGDATRLTKDRQNQENAYTQARVYLAEYKYDEALAIYARYKDDVSRRVALKQKATHFMESNDYESAMQAYRDAGAADEIKNLMVVIDERKQALSSAKNMEASGRSDEALALYAKATATTEVARLARKLADAALAKQDSELAATYYEMAGDYAKAGSVRQANHLADASSLKKLEPQELYQRCLPATVTVCCENGPSTSVGSGFFVAKGGYILTNHHVIEDGGRLSVITSDGKEYQAKVLKSTDTPDLALLKIGLASHSYLVLADSEKVQTGASVYAIGSPGVDHRVLPGTFSQGMISNTKIPMHNTPVFQMTVLINHGNSGGPLLDDRGRVVGINTYGSGTLTSLANGQNVGSDIQGINFAIKINEARALLELAKLSQ